MKPARLAPLAAAAFLLAGCSGAPEPETVVVTSTEIASPENQPTQPEQPEQPEPEQPTPQPTRGVPGAPLAYPGAGGPIPPNARPVRSVKHLDYGDMDFAVFKAPSGNIGCEMSLDGQPHFACGVASFSTNHVLGTDPTGKPNWMVDILTGQAHPKGDPPLYFDEVWPEDTVPAETVQYGEVVYHGPFVCAVEETGVTCWDSDSGHGAWLERENATFF